MTFVCWLYVVVSKAVLEFKSLAERGDEDSTLAVELF